MIEGEFRKRKHGVPYSVKQEVPAHKKNKWEEVVGNFKAAANHQ